MADLYQNKYRIPPARLQTWNYAELGMYFVTICTKDRECFFGEIVNDQMHLSALGKVAEYEWKRTAELRPDMNLELGEFIVMPNHMHGIISIGNNIYNSRRGAMHRVSGISGDTGHGDAALEDAAHGDATHGDATHGVSTGDKPVNRFGPQSKNLSSVIRGYKSAITTYSRKNDSAFAWQERFHDHIIRSEKEYCEIANYIMNNPVNWQKDKFYR